MPIWQLLRWRLACVCDVGSSQTLKRIHRTASRLFPILFQRPIPRRAVVAVAARSQNASSLERCHAFAGEFIGALVFWVTGMALDPVPVDFVPSTELVEALP